MRIISDFKDFYDCVMRMGTADDLVYLRKEEEKLLDRNNFPGFSSYSRMDEGFTAESAVIGFCGKIYGCLILDHYDYKKSARTIAYSIEDVDTFVEKNLKKKQVKLYKEGNGTYQLLGRRFVKAGRGKYKHFFDTVEKKKESFTSFFEEQKTAIFIIHGKQWKNNRYWTKATINGRLNHYKFARIFDPYTAYQELYMYVANTASPEKPIPAVSDADMLEAKGFDPRWSFRKPPGKKRKRKKK